MDSMPPSERMAEFTLALVEWFNPLRRPFPWRQSADLYYVTVCEVLLQRTNAEKVAKQTAHLFERFPTPEDLAEGDPQEIEAILQPLGLPQRFAYIRMIAAAFAQSERLGQRLCPSDLASLPGVGPYCLAAIKVMVCGDCDAVIDEHVLRVLRRVFGVHAPPRRHPTKALTQFARALVHEVHPKEYNLAILDLGRLICRPKNPKCSECPAERLCDFAGAARRIDG